MKNVVKLGLVLGAALTIAPLGNLQAAEKAMSPKLASLQMVPAKGTTQNVHQHNNHSKIARSPKLESLQTPTVNDRTGDHLRAHPPTLGKNPFAN